MSLLDDGENKQPVMNSAALKKALKKELPGASPLPTARSTKPGKAASTAINLQASSIWDYSHAEAEPIPDTAAAPAASDHEAVSKGPPAVKSEPEQSSDAATGADVLKLEDDEVMTSSTPKAAAADSPPAKPSASELLERLKRERASLELTTTAGDGKDGQGISDFLLLEDASGERHFWSVLGTIVLCASASPAPDWCLASIHGWYLPMHKSSFWPKLSDTEQVSDLESVTTHPHGCMNRRW